MSETKRRLNHHIPFQIIFREYDRVKKIFYIITSFILVSFFGSYAHADISYGAKFLFTTAGGCAVGGLTEFAIAKTAGYDKQPTQIISLLGATSGCLTGALFSYFFYDDKSLGSYTQIVAQKKISEDLALHFVAMHGQMNFNGKKRH